MMYFSETLLLLSFCVGSNAAKDQTTSQIRNIKNSYNETAAINSVSQRDDNLTSLRCEFVNGWISNKRI